MGHATDIAVARYNSDGSLDAGFGVGGKVLTNLGTLSSEARDVALFDGQIIVAGGTEEWTLQGTKETDVALVRYK